MKRIGLFISKSIRSVIADKDKKMQILSESVLCNYGVLSNSETY